MSEHKQPEETLEEAKKMEADLEALIAKAIETVKKTRRTIDELEKRIGRES